MKKLTAMMACCAVMMTASAKVRLPQMISDGMVIQQQTQVRLWGWAKKGHTVTVPPSWGAQPQRAVADKDGKATDKKWRAFHTVALAERGNHRSLKR